MNLVELTPRRTLNTEEVAAIIGCSREEVRELAHAGELHAWRWTDTGPLVYDVRDVEILVAQLRRADFFAGLRPSRVARRHLATLAEVFG